MKTRRIRRISPLLALVLLAGGLWATPGGAQASRADEIEYPPLSVFAVPQPTRVELANGMVLILIEDHELPLIDIVAMVETGQRLDPEDKAGLAALTGAVMRTGGTREMTGDEIDRFLEGRAASVETSIGIDSGRAAMSCLAEDLEDVLPIFAQVLRRPVFEEDKLAVAKNQANTSIARQNDDPQQILFREFAKVLLGADSPYARPDTYNSIAAISRTDLEAFHSEYFHPNNVVLGAVGDFDSADMIARIEAVFGDWERGPESESFVGGYRTEPAPGVFYVEKNDVNQSSILIGHQGVRRDNPDFYAIEVFNELLGGGFVSRLFTRVRSQKGLAYAVSGSLGSDWDREGRFQLFTTTKTETTGSAIEALILEARKVASDEPPTDAEVERAKRAIIESFVFTSDSSRKILGQQLTYEYYGYPLDWLARYIDGIRGVTTEQVRAVAGRYVKPDDFTIAVVGPAAGRDRPLEDFGPVTELDVTIPELAAELAEATPETIARGAELLAAAVTAHGGQEALAGFESIRQRASAVATAQGVEQQVEVDQTVVYPDRLRQAVSLPQGIMVQVVTPDTAFIQTPGGTRPLPSERRATFASGLQRTLPVLLRSVVEGRVEAQALDTGTVGDREVQYVALELRGVAFSVGVDVEDGRILEVVFQGSDFSGTPGEVRQRFGDFRGIDGLTLPFAVEAVFEGEPYMTSIITDAAVNGELDQSLFEMPEGGLLGSGELEPEAHHAGEEQERQPDQQEHEQDRQEG